MESSKKIGIWGLGIVGKAAVRHFYRVGYAAELMENRALTTEEQTFLTAHNATFVHQQYIHDFLNRHTHILASPGIDLTPYLEHQHKWITELDILRQEFSGKIIAITGSVGKTTVTHLLSQLINSPQFTVWTGGNIGVGMLELLECSKKYNTALLEVSSFQLEHCKTFAPDLAIWTNLYPNHLDRHSTVASYTQAKKKMLAYQQADQRALVPLTLKPILENFTKSNMAFFHAEKPSEEELHSCKTIYFIDGQDVVCSDFGNPEIIASLTELPDITFAENWLIIISAMHQLGLSTAQVAERARVISIPEHRLEKVATINNIDFYNDSKSTQPASTLAAIAKLRGKKTHLFLGGKSKGIDRTDLIKKLREHEVVVYSFGCEAEQLKKMCDAHQQLCTPFATLDDAFADCIKSAQPGEQLLFSPAGASFDLFKNYQERGEYFKKLVNGIESKQA